MVGNFSNFFPPLFHSIFILPMNILGEIILNKDARETF